MMKNLRSIAKGYLMKLKSLAYSHGESARNKWEFETITFEDINLIVGANATGKTRILNLIGSFAKYLSGKTSVAGTGSVSAEFEENENRFSYLLEFENALIRKESFSLNDEILMQRDEHGRGTIFAEELNRELRFGIGAKQLAFSAKRDTVQHKFLESLAVWAEKVRHYPFAENMWQRHLMRIADRDEESVRTDPSDPKAAVSLFYHGERTYKGFREAVISDFEDIGYQAETIEVGELNLKGSDIPSPPLPGPVFGLKVKEKDLDNTTEQSDMSQGMFRALSVIIHISYAKFSGSSGCILLDDIGEGLDFDRSTRLIKLIIKRAKENDFQLIMTTNDRFVMNAVPLKYWAVLLRQGNTCRILNYGNSGQIFEDFEMIGLNNFDFFSQRFWEERAF